MAKQLAYYAQYKDEDWCMLIHGETRSKAKYRFSRCDPSCSYDHSMWTEIRLKRIPEWDDKPFDDCPEIRELFIPEGYTKDEEPIYSYYYNDCNCDICCPPIIK